ncbi:TIGR03016 family PEP-CTERM system-associated outer membrane protein [Zooshikella ganghwensis]|uniref:TIGR03016 family PEP-CTERM system-associated outer membrane protein n=2 Tax=Zooshikella ganghwensis TaxID=202772 RepID=A0A4P9VQ78_9GAMM|nr:TIGR03016 family PEP-CTERM system-associated outer membrane protein [Zooshikella ganghwensis]
MGIIMGTTEHKSHNLVRYRCVFTVSLVVTLSTSMSVFGAQWTIQPAVTVQDTYSDNINLSNDNEESDQVLEIRPSVRVVGDGSRLKLNFDYALQSLHYLENTNSDETRHQMSGFLQSELLENHLFFDARSSISQQLKNESRGGSSDNISGSSNIDDVYTYELSPYWVQRIGSVAQAQLRYTFNSVEYDDSGDTSSSSDSTQDSISAVIASQPSQKRTFWSLNYDYSKTDYKTENDTELTSYSGTLGYRWSRKFSSYLTLGYESQDNDIESVRHDTDGTFWILGGDWQPSALTSISASFGERYYGDTYGFRASHRRKRSLFVLSYNESQQSTRDQVLLDEGVFICKQGTRDASDCRERNPGEQPGPDEEVRDLAQNPVSSLTDDYFINKVGRLDWIYTRGKSQITLGGYQQRRQYQSRDIDEDTKGVNFDWQWTLNRRTTANFGVDWSESHFDTDDSDNDTIGASIGLHRRLSRDLDGSIRFSSTRRSSNIDENEYTENRISVSVRKTF